MPSQIAVMENNLENQGRTTAIVDIQDIDENDIQGMEYSPGYGEAKVLLNEKREPVAYIWCEFPNDWLYLDMIEVIQKEQGLGTKAIQFLFKHYPIKGIEGRVLLEQGMRPYYFWESLGAKFDYIGDADTPEEAWNKFVDIVFTLEKS